jgi:hypothetical protein
LDPGLGTKSQASLTSITPTPSETMWQAVFTPVGTFSVFGFKTPIPYPFGMERTGYLVSDFDAAIDSAKANHADVVVEHFQIRSAAMLSWLGREAFICSFIGTRRRRILPVYVIFQKTAFTFRQIAPMTLSAILELLRRRQWFPMTERRPASRSEDRMMCIAVYAWIRSLEKLLCWRLTVISHIPMGAK